MSSELHAHRVPYRTYLIVLITLVLLTFLSVLLTGIDLGKLAVTGALLVASIKAMLVLWHFMHLKYETGVLRLMVGLVLFVLLIVLIIIFLDYGFQN